MNKYQEALDKVLMDNPKIQLTTSDIHSSILVLKKLVDKETILPLKTEINEHNAIDELCPICNNSIQKWDKYCSKCGQRVRC